MTPEEKARKEIDRQLEQCGWIVQDYRKMNISASRGVAVREFPLTTGSADYLLYVEAKVIGVVEAKPEGFTLTGVETQSDKYLNGLPPTLPAYRKPIPFAYESTGTITQFTNGLEPDARSREVFTFHRPEELLRLVGLESQLRASLRKMPPLDTEKLWRVQIKAITRLEKSLAANRPRALIQMATGSGKTFTAVTANYRLTKFAGTKRVLFLVDRSNLGRQTYNEFQQFISPVTGYKFTDEFNVQHLRSNTIDPVSRVCITTIQRLYSMLKGEPEFAEENEEQSMFEVESPLVKEPLPVVYNPLIPPETFDVIIVDECHRSIYNLWRQVLDYFDAFLIGLTATPTKQTIGFFNNNLVMEYGHEQAVADHVNVGFDVYRIETQITKQGAILAKEPGKFVPHRDRRTRKMLYKELDDDRPYTAEDLDRDVVAEDQIRLVISTFRDRLFTDIFPKRTEVPKTLVFAKDDSHAEDITKIIREEFGRGNDFCQKITYKTTGKKPEDLLAEFRNSFNPRIAVTVDMIATGTDVKPLECLLFMRNVKSAGYFEQMKGRGVRVVDPVTLQSVTPDAKTKTHFVIVDAVGVCEQIKTTSKPSDRKPYVSLKEILQMVASGVVHADVTSTLGERLIRLDAELNEQQRQEVATVAKGKDLATLAGDLSKSIDPDNVDEKAREKFSIPPEQEPTEQQQDAAEQELMQAALKPFYDPKLRELILALKQSVEQIIDKEAVDVLLRAEFDAQSVERAKSLITNFNQFIEDNRQELEALQILYSKPYRAGLHYRQVKELGKALELPPVSASPDLLWRAFEAVEPGAVAGHGGKLVDVIAMVRHAIDPAQVLKPFPATVEERYQQWLTDQQAAGVAFTHEQRHWLDAIKDHIANSASIEQDDLDSVPFNQMGGQGKAYDLFGEQLGSILDELNMRLAA
ncbi:MAG: DEAD/DEAH box helicase family protein [Thermoguttaceae bacterium]